MIHVCYSINSKHGRYAKFAGISILSLLENSSEDITIHILHDSTLTESDRRKLISLVYRFDREIFLYNIDELKPNWIQEMKNRISNIEDITITIGGFYRLMIHEILPPEISKAIYLDSDTIVNLDIAELWNIDLESYPLAAVPALSSENVAAGIKSELDVVKEGLIESQDYFNSGVLVFDLNKLRSSYGGGGDLLFKTIDILKNNSNYLFADQDALNILFNKNYLKLSDRFNIVINLLKTPDQNPRDGIIHYAGGRFNFNFDDCYNQLLFKYFLRTPFFSMKTFANLKEVFDTNLQSERDLYESKSKLWQKLVKSIATRKRAFFIYPNYLEQFTKFFGSNHGDLILNASLENSTQTLIDIMQKSRNEFIFLIGIVRDQYSSIRKQLLDLGFEEDQDFFNIERFLFDQHAVFSDQIFIRGM